VTENARVSDNAWVIGDTMVDEYRKIKKNKGI